ncbi:MAG TPA: patatin-like phospholipase family protein [Anaerolineae bacterium]|nr:patatin-like phospholipase family protein [Anaerolineae bacterium]
MADSYLMRRRQELKALLNAERRVRGQRPRVGLALGGGVARGPAHIGALIALEQAGIPIDCVAGTSAGAVVGAAYCAGLSLMRIRELSLATRWWRVADLVLPLHGFITFQPMEHWLESQIGVLSIEDLAVPFTAVAMDLTTGEPILLKEGPLSRAVRASCSVPGFVEPVWHNGRWLCDGGVVDNLPVAAVKTMNPDYIIGVDLFTPAHNRRLGPLGPGSTALEMLIQGAGAGVYDADCVIAPQLSGKSYFRFGYTQEYIRLGIEAAQKMIPQIKKDLGMCEGEE